MDSVISGYAARAAELSSAWGPIDGAQALAPIAAFLPERRARVLDVGAGTGAGARWLSTLGHRVTAVEPVAGFRRVGRGERVRWQAARLPRLDGVGGGVALCLCLGVLHHLPPDARVASFVRLAGVLRPRGRLILSLRDGPGGPGRRVFPVDPRELRRRARGLGLRCLWQGSAASIQPGNRAAGVVWTWLVFERVRA